jgi:class 3 adenylate cyclase
VQVAGFGGLVRAARPETRYARVGDADIAYQVFGEGPPDLVFFGGLGFHVELNWQVPDLADLFTRLASFSRLVVFDRRGTGASDGVPRNAIPIWEDLAEDASAVLNAVGSNSAAILATVETGPMALLFATMHPERVSALILVGTYARYLAAEDYPIGLAPEALDMVMEMVTTGWGSRDLGRIAFPSRANDEDCLDRTATQRRSGVTPRSAAAQYDYLLRSLDVRPVLPLVQAPTLVLHAKDNFFIPVEMGRFLAENIENATFVELPGGDISVIGDSAITIPDEVAEFLTGRRPVEIDRVLTTVLFTDIVGSTGRAASLGDRRWGSVLNSHDQAVREQLRRFRGREINTTGDGFVASFDGPARAIRCARAIGEATESLGVKVRSGLHTGECEVRGDDLGGLAVHIAARIGSLAGAQEVLVSATVKDLVMGSGIEFEDRGEHELKGVPGSWRLHAVSD